MGTDLSNARLAADFSAAPRHVRVAGQDLWLHVESHSLIAAMIADIERATRRVWIEAYTFFHDSAGKAIAEALQNRARAGLDVRVMYDAIGSQSTSAAFFDGLAEAGVRVHAFHTIWDALRRFSFFQVLNHRNHRKLVVIDDEIAYFGGMNLNDPTAGDQRPRTDDPAGVGGWRDVHVRLVGTQARDVAESFERSWCQAHHLPISRRSRAYRRARLPAGNDECIRFFDSGPGPRYTRAARIFIRLMRRARQSLLLSMAYFIPSPSVLRALLRARRRGNQVLLIVPAESDVKLVERASRFLYAKLLGRGIQVYERQNRMLHSKIMVVDGNWTVVGSSNLDPRSLEFNREFLAVIRSRAFAAEAIGICQSEIRHSHRLIANPTIWQSRRERLLDHGAYLLRAWL